MEGVYVKALVFFFFYPHLRTFFSLILERKEGREGGRGRNIEVRETLIGCLLICAMTRDQTCNLGMCDLLVRMLLQPTEQYRPGQDLFSVQACKMDSSNYVNV